MFKVQKDKKKVDSAHAWSWGHGVKYDVIGAALYEEGQICARGHLILDSSELDSDLRLGSNRTSSITTFLVNS